MSKRFRPAAVVLATLAVVSMAGWFGPGVPAAAQAVTPAAAVSRLFTAPAVKSEWFAPSFLDSVPFAQVTDILHTLVAQYGPFQRVETDASGGLVTVLQHARFPTLVQLDGQGRFTGLLFKPPTVEAVGPSGTLTELAALEGKTAISIEHDGASLAAANADVPLAVGSAFKLAVLVALVSQIQAGTKRWDDTANLTASVKSLPSGTLQTWPNGTPLTLATLATMMISESDNTAADMLIGVVGREAVEAVAPRNKPFLTTREAFVLKDPANASLRDKWLAGDEAMRRGLLSALDASPLPSGEGWTEVRFPQIEWYFTTHELCTLIERVATFPLMGVNPGLADPRQWKSVAYKGGSEPGVLNFTTALIKGNSRYCVSATWNNTKPLEEQRLIAIYQGAIANLGH